MIGLAVVLAGGFVAAGWAVVRRGWPTVSFSVQDPTAPGDSELAAAIGFALSPPDPGDDEEARIGYRRTK